MIATNATFACARLLEPIDRPQHIQFIERRITGRRFSMRQNVRATLVGDVACREFVQTFPCPPSSYPAEEQNWVDWSLRKWAKSTEIHSTDQNHLCDYRYNRHVFCSGKISPANQTVAVWQMGIPRVPNVLPPPTFLQLIQREKRLIREQRENRMLLSRLVRDYELWCKEQPSESAPLSEWNDILLKHNLPREVDFLRFISPKKSDEQEEGEGYEPEENTFHAGSSSDDEKFSGSEFDHINNNGVRETTEGVPNREQWLEPRRYLFNPSDKTWSEVAAEDMTDATNRLDFAQTVREYAIEFSNLRVKEAAEQLGLKPNTLSQRISRQELNSMFHDVDFPTGHFFCVVTLKGVNFLKILGSADASLPNVLAAFLREWKASEVNAVKMVRKAAMKSGVSQKDREQMECDAVEGVRDAYQVAIGLFVPDKDGFGCTYFSFHGHQELIEAALSEWAA